MLVFGKFSLTTKLDTIVNFHIEYLSSKISVQQRSTCKKNLNVFPFVHTKNSSNMHFYRNLCPFGRSDSGGVLAQFLETYTVTSCKFHCQIRFKAVNYPITMK